eukprot:SM000187S03890  [mRNA]  locus=s187:201700:203234:+ [translate_table: standard]
MGRKLYWGSGSFYCWRLQITLEEKGLDYESICISFANKEHKSEAVLAINPRGQVPAFLDGDVAVNDSGAACQYLEAAYPDQGPKLMPDDIKLQALVLQRLWESTVLGDSMRAAFREWSAIKNNPKSQEEPSWLEKKDALADELSIWEKYLEGKEYVAGDSFTLADVFLFPFLASSVRFGLQLEQDYPNLGKYYKNIEQRDSVQRTWPPHWKESPNQDALADL